MSFTLHTDQGDFEFTVPSADGIMFCNGEMCFGAGKLSGPHPYVVGHRTIQEAAQWWYGARYKLMQQAEAAGQTFTFMQKEPYNAPGEPAATQGDGGGGEGPLDARYP